MAKIKTKDLFEKKKDELLKQLDECKKEFVKIKLNLAVSKEKNVHALLNKRKEIAKIKTVLKEKNLEAKND